MEFDLEDSLSVWPKLDFHTSSLTGSRVPCTVHFKILNSLLDQYIFANFGCYFTFQDFQKQFFCVSDRNFGLRFLQIAVDQPMKGRTKIYEWISLQKGILSVLCQKQIT